MRWRPGLRSGPCWGSSRRFPDLLVGWGGGQLLPNPRSPRRLDSLRLRRSASVLPNVKSWLRPWPTPPSVLSLLHVQYQCHICIITFVLRHGRCWRPRTSKVLDLVRTSAVLHVKATLVPASPTTVLTSSSAMAHRPRCRVGQFWPKVEDNILKTL